MNAADAAKATEHIKPKRAIPYHWGDIVGARTDAEKFANTVECETKILIPGETITLE
ncbi:MAG: hypothetical protein ACYSTT_22255 [Planctomycetota bacterium]|jgi:L-ascorbate metabolism protein UlaG (beta-lactamase superfamily)